MRNVVPDAIKLDHTLLLYMSTVYELPGHRCTDN